MHNLRFSFAGRAYSKNLSSKKFWWTSIQKCLAKENIKITSCVQKFVKSEIKFTE